jgi:hemolysin-activating ACP:hemolysin acyltransferase
MVIDKYKIVVDSISLMSIVEPYSNYTTNDIISYLLLPIEYNKIRIYYEGDKPIGLITWCWLSTTKSDLFLQDEYTPTKEDFALDTSDKLWGFEFIAPYGHARQMMRAIRKTTKEVYKTNNIVHFRRSYDRHKLHKRML